MMSSQAPRATTHSVPSSTLADVLERVLDKGLVIAGDIKIKLVDIELLTIQIRLVVASVDKAREMGIDWWTMNPDLTRQVVPPADDLAALKARIEQLEQQAQLAPVPVPTPLHPTPTPGR
jgi:gas vesicle protein GvpA/GvpJ/GvpM family